MPIDSSSALAPNASAPGLLVHINPAMVLTKGPITTTVPGQNVALAANATNWVFFNLTNLVVSANQSGFVDPCIPLCVVTTNINSVTSLVDSRPDILAAGGGGSPAGNSGDIQINNAGAFGTAADFNSASFRIGGFGAGLSGIFPGGINLVSSANANISLQSVGTDINLVSAREVNVTAADGISLIGTNAFGVSVGTDNALTMGATTFQVGSDNGTCALKFGASSGDTLGFFNAAAIAKPTVIGAKGGNVALTNLLIALANLGLITNSTT